jgi:RimJ/RimL family protein N-acetyltransferase
MIIKSKKFNNLTLNELTHRDIEVVRKWKNNNSKFFFKKDDISSEEQIIWFNKYLKNSTDYLFVIKKGPDKIGTIGIREYEDNWDIYNVILANNEYQGKGYMSEALSLLIDFAKTIKLMDFTARVLIDNDNIKWYINNHFEIKNKIENYYLVKKR